MKKNVLKTFLALITVFSVIFVGCAGDAGDTGDNSSNTSVTLEETPGTVGKPSSVLLAASEFMKELDANNEKVVFLYYRPDGSYSDWGIWLWEDGGNGEFAYNVTAGKFNNKSVTFNNVIHILSIFNYICIHIYLYPFICTL
jgi:hypothetical protein